MRKSYKALLSVGFLALLLLGGTLLALAAFNDELLNMSNTFTDAAYPSIAVSADGNGIGVVWAERFSGGGLAQGPIKLKGSTDGASLSVDITVDNSTSTADQSWQPDIATDPITATDMHVVWRNQKTAGSNTLQYIYHARCSLQNAVCTETEIASGANNVNLQGPRIAVNATTQAGAHVVWVFDDKTAAGGSDKVVMYRAKKPDGTWTTAKQLSNSAVEAVHPAIAVSSPDGVTNYVHVVWSTASTIQYRRGTVAANGTVDWGTDYTAVKNLLMPSGGSSPDFPAVVALTNTVIALWDTQASTYSANTGYYYAVYAASYSNGDDLNTITPQDITNDSTSYTARLSDNTGTNSGNDLPGSDHAARLQIQAALEPAAGAIDYGTLHVLWHQTNPSGIFNKHDVYYASRPFGSGDCGDEEVGCTWTTPVVNTKCVTNCSSDASAYSMSPDIAVDAAGNLYGVYMEGKNPDEYNMADYQFDIVYNGEIQLVDDTLKIYLPIVVKKAS